MSPCDFPLWFPKLIHDSLIFSLPGPGFEKSGNLVNRLEAKRTITSNLFFLYSLFALSSILTKIPVDITVMVQPNWQGGEFICRTSLCWLYLRRGFKLILEKWYREWWYQILIGWSISLSELTWNPFSSGTMIAINTVIHVNRSIGITKPLLRNQLIYFLKGSPDQNLFIFEINVGKSRIRHTLQVERFLDWIMNSTDRVNKSPQNRLKINPIWISESFDVGFDSFRHWFQK